MTMDCFLIRLILCGFLFISIASGKNLDNDFINVQISPDDLQDSVDFAKFILGRSQFLEKNLIWANVNLKTTSLEYIDFLQSYPEKEALNQSDSAYIINLATNQLKHEICQKFNLDDNEGCLNFLTMIKLDQFIPYCSNHEEYTIKSCLANSNYRSIDGSCNHENDMIKGKSQTAYKRLVKTTNYLDGLGIVSRPFTSPRKIASDLFHNETNLDKRFTFSLIEWAEFILNDLSHTVSRKTVHTRENIICCSTENYNLSPRHRHPFCLPIEIPDNDDFYSKFDVKCLSYVRSLPAISDDCTLGRLEQMNQATHYLDASQIYGCESKKSHDLRLFQHGYLAYQLDNEMFLPFSNNSLPLCNENNGVCFDGADLRANFQPLLMTLHTLFLREHNRIALELKEINRDWDDDDLFEETRRIVIAEIQHITYKEFLPIVLGKNYYKKIINLKKSFDENIDPRVSNSFATAAFKFFISLYDENINLYNENNEMDEKIQLKNIFGGKASMVFDHFDRFLMTLSTQPIQKVDLNVPNDIKNHFHQKSTTDYGLDLISLTIQRGRDHGLSPYTTYREYCGLKKVTTFDDLYPLIPNRTVNELAKVYKRPQDIDLFVGGLAETALVDGILGPTFSCIVANQFLRTQRGDRYFYTNKHQPEPFTYDQLKEIEKVTLAGIFCSNSKVKALQRNVFKMINYGNEMVDCSEIPNINLEYWSENAIF